MFERMLNKQVVPTVEELTVHCGENAERFTQLNAFLASEFQTEQKIVFPYGNKYGWGIGHYRKRKLVCNGFAEAGAFTVMVRLTNAQFAAIYDNVSAETQECIDHKYPCNDGGWIHYRVATQERYDDILKILTEKCR